MGLHHHHPFSLQVRFRPGRVRAPADPDQIQSYSDLLERIDGADRISRKRIERMKEGLEEDLERLKSRKDDMLTIDEIGVDQLVVDEMQEFRKLSFATNQTTLKGVDPNGSQRAWDLFVKTRFLDAEKNPGRALVAASGTPITNTLCEIFTLQKFIQPEALRERGIQEFDAWAANFGETRTELEIQPSGLYKPVTRFCEFVNIPDLMAIYRMSTDVVLKSDLRQHLRLPKIAGGRRQIVAAPASPAFLTYQRTLAERIKEDFKKSSAKQRLFTAVNGGQVRILIGSSETMGTGVNAQRRLKALHHLDVPWLPSQIEQREGRIERQGNENDEIEIYGVAAAAAATSTAPGAS